MPSNPAVSSALMAKLQQAQPSIKKGAIVVDEGREGTGKTSFALTVANLGPTVFIPMDREPQGDYLNDQLRTHKIMQPKTSFKLKLNGKTFDQSTAVKLWEELKGVTVDVFKEPSIRAVIWDTGTYAWELLRMARFGKLTQVMPHHYGPVNSEFETVMYQAEEYGKILCIVHKQSKEYKQGKDGKENWTGGYKRAGYSNMGYVANIVLEHFKTEENEFGVRVVQNKIKPELDGQELIGDMCQFPVLAASTWGGELEDYLPK